MTHQRFGEDTLSAVRRAVTKANLTLETARKATEKAEQRRAKEEESARRRADEQASLESRLDARLAEAITGLRNILELGKVPELRELINARGLAGEGTLLFSLGDEYYQASVLLTLGGVVLSIDAHVPSSCQTVGAMRTWVNCTIEHSFAYGAPIEPGWFWRLYHHDPYFDWSPFKDLEYEAVSREGRRHARAEVGTLSHLDQLNLKKLAALLTRPRSEEDDLYGSGHLDSPHICFILLRFLMDCAKPTTLKKNLDAALAKLN